MAGCGSCGKSKKTTTMYKYVSADGSIRRTFDSEVQAKAAKIKHGGSYTVVTK